MNDLDKILCDDCISACVCKYKDEVRKICDATNAVVNEKLSKSELDGVTLISFHPVNFNCHAYAKKR